MKDFDAETMCYGRVMKYIRVQAWTYSLPESEPY